MSTYGAAIIADLTTQTAANQLATNLEHTATITTLDALLQPSTPQTAPDNDVDTKILPDGRYRLSVYQTAIIDDNAEKILTALGPGRAIIADDWDDYGICFTGWKLTNDAPECIYRAYIYDPDGDINEDATGRDINDTTAAHRLAELWDVPPEPIIDAIANTNEIIESLGIIGTPFDPWIHALQLEWPA
jgi:hypothetical protein